MKLRFVVAILVAIGTSVASVRLAASAQDKGESVGPTKAELEKTFKDMLTDVVLRGTWQMTGAEGLKGKAPLTEPRPERYTIKSVSKGLDDNWVITARVEYANRDATLPISVRVVWSGDTPIITLDKLTMPGLGTYSARVMIYDGFYAGTWFGSNYGGVLSGQIIKAADEEKIKKLEEEQAKKEAAKSNGGASEKKG